MKFLLFLLFPILSTTVFAAEAKHTCRILFLNGPANAPKTLQLFDGSQCLEVDLPRMNFSKVYELPAGPLTLRMLATPSEDPTKIPSEAPSAKIAENMQDFYLLVISDPSNPIVPVRLQAIDASAGKLKLGEMLWFNLTKNRVGGTLGTEKLDIRPDSRAVVSAPASGNEDYKVNLVFLIPGNEQQYPLCETKWRHNPRSRSVAFIIAEAGNRSPRVMVFSDYRESTRESTE